MKYLFLMIVVLFTFSCRCPDCFTPPPRFRLIINNENGENLLDPNNSKRLEVLSFEYEDGEQLDFFVKDYVIKGSPNGLYYFGINSNKSDNFYGNCIAKETRFYLKFKNLDIDTLDIKFDEVEESRCCSYYKPHLNYNGLKILKGDSTIGAFIVVK